MASYWELSLPQHEPALVARWNGDADGDSTPDALDTTGAHDAAWVGAEAYDDPPPGKVEGGRAFDLDGASYLSVTPSAPAIAAGYAVSCWLNCASAQPVANTGLWRPPGTTDGYLISQATGRLWGRHDGAEVIGDDDGPVVEGAGWTHVVIAYDSSAGAANVFVDGALFKQVTGLSDWAWTLASFGEKTFGATVDEMLGLLCDFRLYSRALTLAEAQELFAGPEPTNTAEPVVVQSGAQIDSTPGGWNAYGNGALGHEYQWEEHAGGGWQEVVGAASATLSAGLVHGRLYRCRVRGLNDGGYSAAEDATSAAVAYVGPVDHWVAEAREQAAGGAERGDSAVAGSVAGQVITN